MGKLKKILLIIAIIIVALLLIYLGINYAKAGINKTKKDNNPIVTMEVEDYGTIKIELYPDMAPNTVKNFVALVNSGYYNGKTFSEITDDSIIGGFDLSNGETEEDSNKEKEDKEKEDKDKEEKNDEEKATVEGEETSEEEEYVPGPKLSNIKTLKEGEEDSAYSIEGEYVEAGYTDNTLSHQRGVISMKRDTYEDYQYQLSLLQMMGYESYIESLISLMDNTAGSGFFIVTETNTAYDGQYAAFGKVIEGMDVVDKISEAKVKESKSEDEENAEAETIKVPEKEIKISKVTVDTKGIDYGVPETSTRFDFDALFSQLLSNYSNSQN